MLWQVGLVLGDLVQLPRLLHAVLLQALASVILPGFTINRIVHYTSRISPVWHLVYGVVAAHCRQGRSKKVIPTIVGLGCIPLIIHPLVRCAYCVCVSGVCF